MNEKPSRTINATIRVPKHSIEATALENCIRHGSLFHLNNGWINKTSYELSPNDHEQCFDVQFSLLKPVREKTNSKFSEIVSESDEIKTEYDFEKILSAINTIKRQCEFAKEASADDCDDYTFTLIEQLKNASQKILYHLTQGKDGTKSNINLYSINLQKDKK